MVLRLLNDDTVDLKVGELIDLDSWTWNVEKLRVLFASDTVEEILVIPLV